MPEYTPTTDEVRKNMAFGVAMAAYVVPEETHAGNPDWPIPGYREKAKTAFDRWLAAHDAEVRDAALKEAATRRRDASRLSDFGADAQTAEERRVLSERWEREHPGVDSSASRLRPREEGKDQ